MGSASQSIQIAPFDAGYEWKNTTPYIRVWDNARTKQSASAFPVVAVADSLLRRSMAWLDSSCVPHGTPLVGKADLRSSRRGELVAHDADGRHLLRGTRLVLLRYVSPLPSLVFAHRQTSQASNMILDQTGESLGRSMGLKLGSLRALRWDRIRGPRLANDSFRWSPW